MILEEGIGRSADRSYDDKLALAHVLLDSGWIELIAEYYEILYKEMSDPQENAVHTKYPETALTNLCRAMDIVFEMVITDNKNLLLKTFDQSCKVMCDFLKHDLIAALLTANARYGQATSNLYSILVNILRCFLISEITRTERLTQLRDMDIEESLRKYATVDMDQKQLEQTLIVLGFCEQLRAIEKYPQLSVRKMESIQPSDENMPEFLETVEHVKKRLCHASLQELVDKSLIYVHEFQ